MRSWTVVAPPISRSTGLMAPSPLVIPLVRRIVWPALNLGLVGLSGSRMLVSAEVGEIGTPLRSMGASVSDPSSSMTDPVVGRSPDLSRLPASVTLSVSSAIETCPRGISIGASAPCWIVNSSSMPYPSSRSPAGLTSMSSASRRNAPARV